MARAGLIACALVVTACGGGDPAARPPPPRATAASIEATPKGPDDLIVATVDGHPVYGSCVAMQAEALHLSAREALDQCVAFELMAQAADARGLRTDHDAVDAWRREMVRALIEQDLGPITSLDALPADFRDRVLARVGASIDIPYLRGGHYGRIEIKLSERSTPAEALAKQAIDAAYEELKDDPAVLPDQLVETVTRHAAPLVPNHRVSGSPEPYLTPSDDSEAINPAVPEFRNALFAIPSIGRVSPPIRTRWGWEIVLWWNELPAMDMRPRLFSDVRAQYFLLWSHRIGRSFGVTIEYDLKNPTYHHDNVEALGGE